MTGHDDHDVPMSLLAYKYSQPRDSCETSFPVSRPLCGGSRHTRSLDSLMPICGTAKARFGILANRLVAGFDADADAWALIKSGLTAGLRGYEYSFRLWKSGRATGEDATCRGALHVR